MQRTFIALRELVELKRLFGGSLQFRRRQSPVQGRGRRSPSVRAVVEGIEAGVVVVAVERNPVGSIDASAGGGGGASRIRGGDLEPPPGGSGDCADLGGDFCEILILAEYQSDVELAGAGHADEVEGKSEVDAFLAGNKDALGGAVLGGDGLRVVSERTRRYVDARTAHGHEAMRPVGVPAAIAPRIGDPGVETDLVCDPAVHFADDGSEFDGVVVGVGVAERGFGVVEQILAVEEGDGALHLGFDKHWIG